MKNTTTTIKALCLFLTLAIGACGDKNKRLSAEDGETIDHRRFYVEQVTEDGDAIARTNKDRVITDGRLDYGVKVLFLKDKNNPYYDGQEINIPNDEFLVQVGAYTYEEIDEFILLATRKEMKVSRTIPIVAKRKYKY